MRLGKESGAAAALLKNQQTFWSSLPSRRYSMNIMNIQGTIQGNHYPLKVSYPFNKTRANTSGRHVFFSCAEKYAVQPSTFQTEFSDLSRSAALKTCI